VRASALDGSLRLEIEDTGMGMSARDVRRIFEPYFSTKDSGTGLGLPIARRAIEEHGGSIEVSSRPGIGTTMRVVLPLDRGEGSPASATARAPEGAGEREG
jgi:signal transduction histidine kinase